MNYFKIKISLIAIASFFISINSHSAQIDLTSGQTWGVTRSGIQHNFDEIYPIIGNVPLLNGTHTITGTYSFPDIGYDVTTWNGIFTPVTKNSFRDYMYNFDADGDGSFTDETWFPATHSALTLGENTNGLSILGQVLSLDLADTDSNGSLAFGDYNFIKSIDTELEFKSLYNLEIGTDVQAYSSYLGNIAGLTPTANSLIGWNSGATALENKSTITLTELNVGEINSTAVDGDRRITLANNTTFDGASVDPGTNRITSVAGVPGYVDTSNVFHAFSSGNSGYVSTPTYSDSSCTVGQWSFDADYCYICEATNQWDRYPVTFANWSNPTPDTTDPEIVITTPATDGSWVDSATYTTLAGTASDNIGVQDIYWKLESGGTYANTNVTGTTTWSVSSITLAEGLNSIYVRARDAATNDAESIRTINVDTVDPVVGTVTPDQATHDGTGTAITVTVASITETNESTRQYQIYDVTDAAVEKAYQSFTGLTINETLPADQHTYRIDVRCTDVAGNTGTASSADIAYSGGVACSTTPFYSNVITDYQTRKVCGGADIILCGGKSNFATTITNVCSIDVYVKGVGDVDGYTYQVEHWSGGSASSMGAFSSASTAVIGTAMPDNGISSWVKFDFSTPVNIANGDAIVLTRTDHTFSATNYLLLGHDSATTNPSFFYGALAGINGVTYYAQNLTIAMNFKIYQEE